MINQQHIANEYQSFVTLANELTEKDIALYQLERKETKHDRFMKHLIGMIEMYSIRYGDPDQRLTIVEYIDKHLFPDDKVNPKVSWQNIRKTILSGEYHDQTM
jgi:hypothetical protein